MLQKQHITFGWLVHGDGVKYQDQDFCSEVSGTWEWEDCHGLIVYWDELTPDDALVG